MLLNICIFRVEATKARKLLEVEITHDEDVLKKREEQTEKESRIKVENIKKNLVLFIYFILVNRRNCLRQQKYFIVLLVINNI